MGFWNFHGGRIDRLDRLFREESREVLEDGGLFEGVASMNFFGQLHASTLRPRLWVLGYELVRCETWNFMES